MVPPKTGRPLYCVLARLSSSDRSWVISVATAWLELASLLPVELAWTTRSRARPSRLLTDDIVVSSVDSHASPSEALREYWLLRSISPCSDRASTVPLGSSDAVLIRLPDDNCCWRVAPRCRLACRLASVIEVIELLVTLMVSLSQRCRCG